MSDDDPGDQPADHLEHHKIYLEYESRPIAKVRATCSCRRWSADWVRQHRERLITIMFVDHARKS